MQGMMGNEDLYSTTSLHFLHSRCTGHFDWEKYRTNVMVCDMQNAVRTIRLRKNTWFEAGLHQEKKYSKGQKDGGHVRNQRQLLFKFWIRLEDMEKDVAVCLSLTLTVPTPQAINIVSGCELWIFTALLWGHSG